MLYLAHGSERGTQQNATGWRIAAGRGPVFPTVALHLLTDNLCQSDENPGIQKQGLTFTFELAGHRPQFGMHLGVPQGVLQLYALFEVPLSYQRLDGKGRGPVAVDDQTCMSNVQVPNSPVGLLRAYNAWIRFRSRLSPPRQHQLPTWSRGGAYRKILHPCLGAMQGPTGLLF